MFTLARALVYASAFVGFVLVFLPARVAEWAVQTDRSSRYGVDPDVATRPMNHLAGGPPSSCCEPHEEPERSNA